MPRLVIVECPTDMSEKFRSSTMNVLTRYPSWFGHFDQLGEHFSISVLTDNSTSKQL